MRQGLVPENARGHAGGDARDRGRPAERDAVGHRRPRREDRAGLAAGGPLGGAGGGPASPRDAVAADVGGREQEGRGVGQLSPEVGAVVRRAIEAACDQVRGADARAAAADGRAGPGAEAEPPSLAQRQADALGVIAECALSGGLDRGTAGDRYQVVVHVDAEALTEAPDVPSGNSRSRRLVGAVPICPGTVVCTVAPGAVSARQLSPVPGLETNRQETAVMAVFGRRRLLQGLATCRRQVTGAGPCPLGPARRVRVFKPVLWNPLPQLLRELDLRPTDGRCRIARTDGQRPHSNLELQLGDLEVCELHPRPHRELRHQVGVEALD